MVKNISAFVIPVIFFIVIIHAIIKKVDVFSAFCEGAADGAKSVLKILPALVGLIAAITMLRTSGALDAVVKILSPVSTFFNIPPDVLPLAILRPISGSGSLAIVNDIFKTCGVDSFAGKLASVMMGSTETTFYALCVYFGSVKVKDTRFCLGAALCADAIGILCSILLSKAFFR